MPDELNLQISKQANNSLGLLSETRSALLDRAIKDLPKIRSSAVEFPGSRSASTALQAKSRTEDIENEFRLGVDLYYGYGIPQDRRRGIVCLQNAAVGGVTEAQVYLAAHYRKSEGRFGIGGFTSNLRQSRYWSRKAALLGNSEGQSSLAFCYLCGIGVTKDKTEALTWFLKAAEQGNGGAQFWIRILLSSDKLSLRSEFERLIDSYRAAAEQGSARAQALIGWTFEEGIGVPEDLERAEAWYLKSAEQGLALGQFSLAHIYGSGRIPEKSFYDSIALYKMAAEQNLHQAQSSLSWLFEEGHYIIQDSVEAYFWLLLASADRPYADFEIYYRSLCEFAQTLAPLQISKAKAKAAEWRRTHKLSWRD